MQTVGQLLQKTREEQCLTIGNVEQKTKIRSKYLEALEKDNYRALPSALAARGFIKNYGQLLKVPNETLQALFRRDFVENQEGQVIPRGIVKPLDRPETFSWTPKRTTLLIIFILVLGIGGYFLWQVKNLNSPPKLQLTQPSENQIFTSSEISVIGHVDPNSSVMINQEFAQVEENGSFNFTLTLPRGRNVITVTATSKTNKLAKITRNVLVQ